MPKVKQATPILIATNLLILKEVSRYQSFDGPYPYRRLSEQINMICTVCTVIFLFNNVYLAQLRNFPVSNMGMSSTQRVFDQQ